jgi:peptide methionine sulfoxide reductase MsrA
MPEPTTRLHVWITDYDEDDEEKIQQLMDQNDFPVQYSHKPSDDGIEFQSHAFEYNDENLELVRNMKEKFKSDFSSKTVEIEDGTLGEHVAIDYFECIRIK